MKKELTLLFLALTLISLVSADIILKETPKDLYNLGDTLSLPLKLTSLTDLSGTFIMKLICNGIETEVYKADVEISSGDEQTLNTIIILEKKRIGRSTGICKIKSELRDTYALTNEFTISDKINVEVLTEQTTINPGESIIIEGNAIKENGKNVNGFVELRTSEGNGSSEISLIETVNKGYFGVNLEIPSNFKAGEHQINIDIYEKDLQGEVTNIGTSDFIINVKQVPNSLELLFETVEVKPGTSVKVKGILHDQTGENIPSPIIISIKDEKNIVLQQTEISTGEFLEFPIKFNSPPSEWDVVGVSNKLTTEARFKILEKREIGIELINKTLTITNKGNVPYTEPLSIKIGEKTIEMNVSLNIDETQKYTLTAPDGEYEIEILAGGENQLTKSVALTGSVIDVKKASRVITLARYPAVWVFIIAIMGFMVFIVAKKGYKRSFIGYIRKKKGRVKTVVKEKPTQLQKWSLVKTTNKAELSLSIKGVKQRVSLVCLKIKNLKEIQSKKLAGEETIQRAINLAEENKAIIYENNENLFFISAPLKTKTFKNEMTSVNIAQRIKKALNEHNSKFKQKIYFGIAINTGDIIAKEDPHSKNIKFMSLGNLIGASKKIASASEGEISLSPEINDKLRANLKTQKQTKNNTDFFTIEEVKKDKEENKKFINEFLHRMERK